MSAEVSFTSAARLIHTIIDAILAGLVGGGLPTVLGFVLLFLNRYYPERFPPKLRGRMIRWNAILLIVLGLLLTVWDLFSRPH